MKKLNLFSMLIVAVVMMLGLTNCSKKDLNTVTKKYVGSVDGSFKAQDGDITFKAYPNAPLGVNREWWMYRHDLSGFSLVDGSEFITGSIAYEFWHNPVNTNPFTISASQAIYSNLTPVEDLRVITETKDANGTTAYLGMIDFNPEELGGQGFPLNIQGYRLGDVLVLNTNALTSLPGGSGLAITIKYNLAPVDLNATKNIPYGTDFNWSQIVYGSPVPTTFVCTISSGVGFVVYDGLDNKVMGNIEVTVVLDGNTAKAFVVNIPASTSGKGMLIKLTTTKVGWYDSATIGITDNDIQIETTEVPIN